MPEETLRAIARELGITVTDLWRLADHGETDYADVVARIGELGPEQRREVLRFAEYLLSQAQK